MKYYNIMDKQITLNRITRLMRGGYENFLEQSPSLLGRYREFRLDANLISLNDELAIMKTLLAHIVGAMAQAAAKKIQFPISHASLVAQFVESVSTVAMRAADLDERRGGRIGAAQMAVIAVGLKNGIEKGLRERGLEAAMEVVETEIACLPFISDSNLKDETAQKAISEYEVKFRVIKNEDDAKYTAVTERDTLGEDEAKARVDSKKEETNALQEQIDALLGGNNGGNGHEPETPLFSIDKDFVKALDY